MAKGFENRNLTEMFIKNQILERNAFLFQKMFILEEKELHFY